MKKILKSGIMIMLAIVMVIGIAMISTANEAEEAVLESIPTPAPVSEIPYARAKAGPAAITAAWTLGNYMPRQIEIITSEGPMMANVAWIINATAIPNDLYNTALNSPQTFPIGGVVTLPAGVTNPDGVSLNVTIIASVDGGKKADIPWTAVRPTIEDSEIWDNAAVLEIGEKVRRSTNHPAGEPTATAVANVLWDDENLYVRLKVTDGNIVHGLDHESDGGELFLSENMTRGNQNAANMNQYRLTSGGAVSFRNTSPTTSLISTQAWRRVIQITDDGYDLFWAIPLLHDNGPVDGKVMLFDIMMNDATMPRAGRTAEISWSDSGHNGFNNSIGWGEITLVRAPANRESILATSGPNGTISPSSVPGRVWINHGGDQAFTFTPAFGYMIDAVTVNGEAAEITGNSFTFVNVTDSLNRIHVTFKPQPDAEVLDFIVWNDNFAMGEFTTAVIIDLGEGREVLGSALSPDLFEVSARNTRLNGTTVSFEGSRVITRVYANSEPKTLGYLGVRENSPDFQEGLESGRYIVVEFEFWTLGGGATTLDASNSTIQNYRITGTDAIQLVDGEIELMIFAQTAVVNEVLDKFERGPNVAGANINYVRYLHRDEDGEIAKGLPLFIYTHGMSRGPDLWSPMRSANGAQALAVRVAQDPERFASHIFAVQATGPNAGQMRNNIQVLIDEGIVDPNRIYASGFSMGGSGANGLMNGTPDFYAAVAPLAPVGGYPTAANAAANADIAYWPFVNLFDGASYQTGVQNFINNAMPLMFDVNVSRFGTNPIFSWPFNQWTLEEMPPFGAQSTAPHEVEATVFWNKYTVGDWNIRPTSSNQPVWNREYEDIFDWMFDQSKLNRFNQVRSVDLNNEEGLLTSQIVPKTGRIRTAPELDNLTAVLTVNGEVADILSFAGYDAATGIVTWTFEPVKAASFTGLDLEATVTYEASAITTSLSDTDVSIHFAPATPFSGTSPTQLNAALARGDVLLTTPGSGGYGIAAGTTLVVPEGRTLYVESILNVRREATLVIKGTVIVLESGRLNSDGHATATTAAGTAATGTIEITTTGKLINYGYVEIAQRSTLINAGYIENNGRFEIRTGVLFARKGTVGGTRPLNINSGANLPTIWTLTFNTDGGTPIAPIRFIHATPVNELLPEDPTKDGYSFVGWRFASGTLVVSQPLSHYSTIVAMWEADAP